MTAKLLDHVVVSTEDEEISAIARSFAIDVLPRPPELALDTSTTLSVLQHVLTQVNADIVTLLQSTSPIRDSDLIDRCIDRFLRVQPDSLATGWICKYRPYGQLPNLRRQDIDGFFYDDGSVYVIRADIIRRGDRYGQKVEMVLTDREQNHEIDDEFDFCLAEQILTRRTTEKAGA